MDQKARPGRTRSSLLVVATYPSSFVVNTLTNQFPVSATVIHDTDAILYAGIRWNQGIGI
jgi:hypothetical protein